VVAAAGTLAFGAVGLGIGLGTRLVAGLVSGGADWSTAVCASDVWSTAAVFFAGARLPMTTNPPQHKITTPPSIPTTIHSARQLFFCGATPLAG
jgi:hypothetical protein